MYKYNIITFIANSIFNYVFNFETISILQINFTSNTYTFYSNRTIRVCGSYSRLHCNAHL